MLAGDIRRHRVSAMRGFRHWRWHLDEMYVKLHGEMIYLRRAVDHEGEVLERHLTDSQTYEERRSAALDEIAATRQLSRPTFCVSSAV